MLTPTEQAPEEDENLDGIADDDQYGTAGGDHTNSQYTSYQTSDNAVNGMNHGVNGQNMDQMTDLFEHTRIEENGTGMDTMNIDKEEDDDRMDGNQPPTTNMFAADDDLSLDDADLDAGPGVPGGVGGHPGAAGAAAEGMDMDGAGNGLDDPDQIGIADSWIVIGQYFREKGLVRQQLESYNEFINNTIQEIVDDTRTIVALSDPEMDNDGVEKRTKCEIQFRQGIKYTVY